MSASLRRQPVAQGSGGLFSTQKVSFSAETQKLLKGQSQYFVHSPTVCQRLQSMNELFTCTYERLFLFMPMTNKSSNTNRGVSSSALSMFCSDDGGVKIDQLSAAAAKRENAE